MIKIGFFQICEELMTRCLAPDCQMGGLGCDNMTVVLVCFLHGKTYEDLADRCLVPYGLKSNNSESHSSSISNSSSNHDVIQDAINEIEVKFDQEKESINNENFSKLSDNELTVA